MESVRFIWDSFTNYAGSSKIWLFYPIALIVIAVFDGKDGRRLFLYPLLLQILTIFNPLIVGKLVSRFGFGERYLRMFWILQYYVVIAYAGMLIVRRFRKKVWRSGAAAVLAAMLIFAGRPVFLGEDTPGYNLAENTAFVEDEYIQLSAIFHSEGKKMPRILYHPEMVLTYREYDPDVQSLITRKALEIMLSYENEQAFFKGKMKKYFKRLMRVYWYDDTNVTSSRFLRALRKRKVDYIVTISDTQLKEYFEENGLTVIGSTAHHLVWRTPDQQQN
ncbi:MAG: hypothetical protein K6C06_01085 [Lachnospiraceae bacterium]|nr:hypothetical protein [Lachnospiraceae bacterium]